MTIKKDYFIGDRRFYRESLAIAIPMMVQEIITTSVNLLDNVMIGRVGTIEMSAVAIINQFMLIVFLSLFGALSGAGIFSSQFAGAKNNDGIRHCFRIKLVAASIILLLTMAVLGLFSEGLIGLYLADDTTPEVAAATIKYGVQYTNIMLIGLLPFFLARVYALSLREVGETRIPMYASIVAIFTNLAFNYILIFGKLGFPRLGVAGAAAATVLSRFIELFILIVATHKNADKYPFIKGVYRSLYAPSSLYRKVISKGLPLLANEFLWSCGNAFYLQCYSERGLQVVAAANIASTINNIVGVIAITSGGTIAVLVGKALGANEHEEAKKTAWRLISLAFVISMALGVILASLSGIIPQIYNTEPEVKRIATRFLLAISVAIPFQSFANGCYFTLRSGGKTMITLWLDSGFMWLIGAPLAYVLANHTAIGVGLVYMIVQSLDMVKSVVGTILIRSGIWISNIVSGEKQVTEEI